MPEKARLLRKAGFTYHDRYELWYRCDQRQIVSRPWMDHHSLKELEAVLGTAPGAQWVMFLEDPDLNGAQRDNLEAMIADRCGETATT